MTDNQQNLLNWLHDIKVILNNFNGVYLPISDFPKLQNEWLQETITLPHPQELNQTITWSPYTLIAFELLSESCSKRHCSLVKLASRMILKELLKEKNKFKNGHESIQGIKDEELFNFIFWVLENNNVKKLPTRSIEIINKLDELLNQSLDVSVIHNIQKIKPTKESMHIAEMYIKKLTHPKEHFKAHLTSYFMNFSKNNH